MRQLVIQAAAFILAFLPAAVGHCADPGLLVKAVLPRDGKFSYIERADLRRFENGKYVGLENREVRGILQLSTGALVADVEGTFYVLQALDHSGAHTAQEIDRTVPVTYSILPDVP